MQYSTFPVCIRKNFHSYPPSVRRVCVRRIVRSPRPDSSLSAPNFSEKQIRLGSSLTLRGLRRPTLTDLSAGIFRTAERPFSSCLRCETSQKPPPRSVIEKYRDKQRAWQKARNRNLLLYTLSLGVLALGISYAAVPLYRAFCAATGYNGTPLTDKEGSGKFSADRISKPVGDKVITVRFNADKADTLNWKFWPCQKSVKVKPGETVLAFFKAKNLSDTDILGVATYNVTPGQVAPYFAKVECFCFDEQRLLAGEEVDLPIFFFIDKDFMDDPLMDDIDDIVLSYTFFKAKRNSFGQLEPDTHLSPIPSS
ncbi:hypothetical protein CROQUDRAFT_652478 [Cronartium quercuum f. sp. fusiforme G11]|uniref:Cytochrome c oxidase assembly protein n=1 Tax=Cronartium quercuum f. sp. fusiforme G11 TaxID=708437 RepID=A0A9P6NRF9_9BASI|nr:hypothetical protein CROQUDRAFT_652478 [Cronartium quercuum f. sp. fusiforme G11]